MDFGVGIAVRLFVELLTLAPTLGTQDADNAACGNAPAHEEQSARPGETPRAVQAECKDEAKSDGGT